MTILEQIKALYDKGITRVAINPQDFDDLIADYIVNATDFIPPFAVELWSTVNCPVGQILPAPNLSELLQKRSYGMMQFPNNKTMICKDCKRLGHPSGFYGDGQNPKRFTPFSD